MTEPTAPIPPTDMGQIPSPNQPATAVPPQWSPQTAYQAQAQPQATVGAQQAPSQQMPPAYQGYQAPVPGAPAGSPLLPGGYQADVPRDENGYPLAPVRAAQAVYSLRPPMHPLAVISLVCSIVAIVVFMLPVVPLIFGGGGVALGALAMQKIAQDAIPRAGKGLAITAIIIGGVAVLIGIIGLLMLGALGSVAGTVVSSF